MKQKMEKKSNKKVSRNVAFGSLLTATAIALLSSSQPAMAQQSAVEALRSQIEELTERLNKIETESKKTSEAVAKNAPTVSAKEKVTISGLLQVRGDAFSGETGPGVTDTANRQFDTFRLRRAEIRLTAPAITSRIGGTVMLDPSKRLSGSVSGSTLTISQASNILQELQLSYLLRKGSVPTTTSGVPTTAGAASQPAVPNNIYIDIGQFKLPIGYEGDLVSSSAIQTIDRALMFGARDPFGGGYGDVRDTGAQIRGTQGQFEYRLGVFNGLGERQNDNATSDNKAFVGRLLFKPRSIQGLQVGVSGAIANTRNNGGTSGGLSQRADRSLTNLFAVYKKNKLTLQTEYLTGDAQRLPSDITAFNRDVRGYYGSIGYLFTPKIEGVFRYDFFDFDRNLQDASVRDLVAGVNYYIKGNNAKLQLNVVKRNGGNDLTSTNGFGSSGSSSNPRGFANDRTEVRIQGQVAF